MPGYKFLFFIHVGSLALYSGMLIFHHINDKKNLKLDKAIHYLYIIVGFLMNEALSINAQLINGQNCNLCYRARWEYRCCFYSIAMR